MTWNRSASRDSSRETEETQTDLTAGGSFHRAARSPAYRAYSACYATGKFALNCAGTVSGGLENIWRMTLSEAFSKLGGYLRGLTELKRARAVRGELSIARFLLRLAIRTTRAADRVLTAWVSRGPAFGFRVARRTFSGAVSGFWTKHRTALNYLAPVAGAGVLALTIYAWSNFTLAVSVSYNHKTLGSISSEKVYKEAADNVEASVTEASGSSFALAGAPAYQLKIVKKSDLLNAEELSDGILSASNHDVGSSFGLYVDDRLVGTCDDSTSIQTMLDSILASYKSDPANDKVAFSQKIQIKTGIFPNNVKRSADDMKAILTASASGTKTYTAQKGDSPEMVANKFHVPVDQIYAMNASISQEGLAQGQTIQVAAPQLTLNVKYTRREVSTQSIPYQIVSTQSASKAKGLTTVTQKGQTGLMEVVSDVTYVGGTAVDSAVISTNMIKAPVNQQQTVGTYDMSGKAASIIDYAQKYLGARYVASGASPSGFDCSGFTMYVFAKYGISLPHSAAGQSGYGSRVSRSDLKPGDLVFFNTTGGISHVGIYIGDGEFVNAENYRSGVTITSLNSSYWSSTYVTARRVLQ